MRYEDFRGDEVLVREVRGRTDLLRLVHVNLWTARFEGDGVVKYDLSIASLRRRGDGRLELDLSGRKGEGEWGPQLDELEALARELWPDATVTSGAGHNYGNVFMAFVGVYLSDKPSDERFEQVDGVSTAKCIEGLRALLLDKLRLIGSDVGQDETRSSSGEIGCTGCDADLGGCGKS